MPIAPVGDLDLYYEMAGAGPRLLLILGTASDLRRKPNLLDVPLTENFEVLAYDQRGMGRSSKPDRALTLADYAADAMGLMDALGWASASVLGVSFGGMVAQELALQAPERVERLALACTSAGGRGGSSYPLHELEDLPLRDRATVMLALDSRRGADWQLANPAQADAAIAQVMSRLAPFDPADAAAIKAASRRQLEARRRHDTFDRLPRLTVPSLVLGGRYDLLAPVAVQQSLAAQLGAPLLLFEGGHNFLMEDSSAIAAAIAFLSGSDANV